MTLGERLRAERERLGMNQPAFAAIARTTKQTLYSWESGKTAPDGFQLGAMAEAGADVRYIVTGDRDYEPPPPLTAEEQTMLGYFRQAEPAVRRAAMGALLGAASAPAGRVQTINAPVIGSVAGGNIVNHKAGGSKR